MAFDTIETSEYFQPIELFQFTRGVFSWYYTSNDRDVSFGGANYISEPINRTRITSTQDIGKTTLKIALSRRNIFAIQFIEQSPTDVIFLTVTRIHASDDAPAVTFRGRVINVEFEENEVTLTCQPNLSSLRRPGLRRLYQTTCPHVLYGPQCKVVRGTFAVTTALTGVSGLSLSSPDFIISVNPTFDATWFAGGFVQVNESGLITRRFITSHDNSSGTININLPLSVAVIGTEVTVYPGCDHDPSTCRIKFDNIGNYGGFPYMPQKNPMNGTSIF